MPHTNVFRMIKKYSNNNEITLGMNLVHVLIAIKTNPILFYFTWMRIVHFDHQITCISEVFEMNIQRFEVWKIQSAIIIRCSSSSNGFAV